MLLARPLLRFSGKPSWLRMKSPYATDEGAQRYTKLRSTVSELGLSTVCQEAKCPNVAECWSGGTATMLMGDTCTRGCRFCAVKTSKAPGPLDSNEPEKVAEAIARWGLTYVVLTSVDRDDLADQGASHIARTVAYLKEKAPDLLVETLLPDFRGNRECVETVVRSGMDVYAHNLETVDRLQRVVRDRRAGYKQSLSVLEMAKEMRPGLPTKTSLMLGLGEEPEEIRQALNDLRTAGVDVVTFGQYLQPTKYHMKVHRYVTPQEFDEWKSEAEQIGFAYVASGPLVRSSYKAGEFYLESTLRNRGKAVIGAV